jgi:pantetheine-phosphate adenylyltransferase
MSRVVCPGSFDPVTRGHLDIIGRTAALVDEVVVAVGANGSKRAWFTPEERVLLLRDACAPWSNVSVTTFDGLLVDFCRASGITAIAKGLRAAADFDYELPMAQMNAHLSGVDTIFVPTSPQWSFVSSSLVREVAGLGGDVAAFLTPAVAERVRQRAQERRES